MTDLKAAFDAWVREYDGSTEMADGQYIDDEVHACWVAYQAAHAAAIEAAAGVCATYDWGSADDDARTWDGDAPGPVEVALDTVEGQIRALADQEVSDGAE